MVLKKLNNKTIQGGKMPNDDNTKLEPNQQEEDVC